MRPASKSVTGISVSTPLVLDYLAKDFQVSVVVHAGTNTCTVNYTLDDIFDPAVSPVWLPLATLTGVTGDQVGNIAFPVRAIQLSQTAGAGTSTMTAVQSSPSP